MATLQPLAMSASPPPPPSPDPSPAPDRSYAPDLDADRAWLRERARRQLGGPLRRVLDSEDLTQETQLKALEGLDGRRFANRRAFRGWLAAILRNVAAQRARRVRGEAELGEVAGRERSPSSAARASDERRSMRRLLARLPERDRKVVAFRLVEELSFREVAERTGTTEAHARMIFSRGVRRLREATGEREREPDRG
jgi:RNA polymerase sigma-70 factor (ECF subfamily)